MPGFDPTGPHAVVDEDAVYAPPDGAATDACIARMAAFVGRQIQEAA